MSKSTNNQQKYKNLNLISNQRNEDKTSVTQYWQE